MGWSQTRKQSAQARVGFFGCRLGFEHPDKLTVESPTAQEMRWKDVAPVESVMVTLTLIYTYRQQRVRVISLRKASQRERKMYDEWIHTP